MKILTKEEIALQLTLKSIEDGLVINESIQSNSNPVEYAKDNAKHIANFYNTVLCDLILEH